MSKAKFRPRNSSGTKDSIYLDIFSPDGDEEVRVCAIYETQFDRGDRDTAPYHELNLLKFEAADGNQLPGWVTESLVEEALNEADGEGLINW